MTDTYHYPPELLQLLIDTIPRLCRSKNDTLLFFRGAGVPAPISADLAVRVRTDRESIDKFEIARTILTRLNDRGDATLRERREVLKRVIEFEDFSTCWPNDELKAKGLVAEIRRVVGVKDAFTRMDQEREKESRERRAQRESGAEANRKRQAALVEIQKDLFALFGEPDTRKRGKAVEGVLNRLFQEYGISVRKAFTLSGDSGEGIVEQIDGIIELDGHLYFVEMKWWEKPLGVPEISEHMMRVFLRAEARALIISASEFTEPAVTSCKAALSQKVVALCSLQELVILLERGVCLKAFLKLKADAAITHKNPYHQPLAAGEL